MSRRIITLIGAAALAATATSITGVVGPAITALADPAPPPFSGQYLYDVKYPNQPDGTQVWTVTPKGPDSVTIDPGSTPAKLTNGKWEMSYDSTITCDADKKDYAITEHLIWDAVTLNGTIFHTYKVDGCGYKTGESPDPNSFTLTKVS